MIPVRKIAVALLAAFLVLSPGAGGAEPADGQIRAALDDIARYEQQFPAGARERAANVKRAIRLLGLTRERLDGSPNRADESWLEADGRLNVLLDRLNGMLAGEDSQPPSPQPSSATAPPASATSASGASAAAAEMISQDRVRIGKLLRDIRSSTETLESNGPKPFQDPGYASGREAIAERYRQTLERYAGFAGDPDVVAATEALRDHETLIRAGKENAADVLASIGDPQAALAAIFAHQSTLRPPPPPAFPYEEGSVDAWVRDIARVRQAMVDDHGKLQSLADSAWLPLNRGTPESGAPYDAQDVGMLQGALVREVGVIDENFTTFRNNLDAQAADVARQLDFYDSLDPLDDHARANSFLGAGQAAENRARLDGFVSLVETVAGLDRLTGRTPPADHEALLRRARDMRASYDTRRAEALATVRMPEPATDDPELVRIARETLADPAYDVGDILRLVINSDVRDLEKRTSEIDIDDVDVGAGGDLTLSGTETSWTYRWKQYQVATAEPVGDTHYIFYNTLKYYTAGADTTPLNRWIVANRIQTVEIPRENIGPE